MLTKHYHYAKKTFSTCALATLLQKIFKKSNYKEISLAQLRPLEREQTQAHQIQT